MMNNVSNKKISAVYFKKMPKNINTLYRKYLIYKYFFYFKYISVFYLGL